MRQNSNMSGMTFVTGILAGIALTFLIPEDRTQKMKAQLSKKAKQLSENLEESIGLDSLRQTFQDTSRDMMTSYQDARKAVMKELRNTYQNWDDINKRKYSETVKKVLQTLRDEQELDDRQLQNLANYLESDFQTFRSQWR